MRSIALRMLPDASARIQPWRSKTGQNGRNSHERPVHLMEQDSQLGRHPGRRSSKRVHDREADFHRFAYLARPDQSRGAAVPSVRATVVMKTTLEIPDPTFRKAKATASALGIPCAGELSDPNQETMRIQKIFDEDFEQIEPEDQT